MQRLGEGGEVGDEGVTKKGSISLSSIHWRPHGSLPETDGLGQCPRTYPIITALPTPLPDYYAVLGLTQEASDEDVNKAWRRLVLVHHPDKQASSGSSTADRESAVSSPLAQHDGTIPDIRLINEARSVLSDPARKAHYLASVSERPGSGEGYTPMPARKEGPHVYRHVSLDEFETHFTVYGSTEDADQPQPAAGVSGDDDDLDTEEADPQWWSYPCRCSGRFIITLAQLEEGVEVVGCEGCGEWLRVGYEVVSGDGEGA
ncbi:hypothetical protein IAU60_000062 [Kwoniella sp. DSM 27419]